MAKIAVLGTLDSKGDEHAYVADLIRARSHQPFLIDVGSLEPPAIAPDVTRQEVARLAGLDLQPVIDRRDRGDAVAFMGKASALALPKLIESHRLEGVISLGGGGGTSIGTAAMRALPVGFPKVMVSTLAGGETGQYIGTKDIVMFPAIVDVAGLNRISRVILARAAGAICGMVETHPPASEDKPVIVASMFGNTTECVRKARGAFDAAGYETLVFHATGSGGRSMESLIESGMVAGVFDITTTEWADELAGGFLSAGPQRLEAAGMKGVPAVVAPGCLDMVNFHGPESVPEKYKDRLFYQHNPQVTLMRTTPDECRRLGEILAEKVNAYTGRVAVLLPLKAISVISAEGQPFYDSEADKALFDAIESNLKPGIPLKKIDAAINDDAFAEAAAKELLALMSSSGRQGSA